jgi:Tfp pilus assembly protein PilV
MHTRSTQHGFSIIEAIIGSAIISIAFIALLQTYTMTVSKTQGTLKKVQASFLAEEGQEAVRSMRDQSWTTYISSLSTSASYYLYFNGTRWTSTTTAQLIDNRFARTIKLRPVYRNSQNDIANSGTFDTEIRRVEVVVSWNEGGATSTASTTSYISNTFGN